MTKFSDFPIGTLFIELPLELQKKFIVAMKEATKQCGKSSYDNVQSKMQLTAELLGEAYPHHLSFANSGL